MRPLPCTSLAGAPPFVRGLSVIRGRPVLVLDLAALLGGDAATGPARCVTIRAGGRPVALAVEEVLGVRPIQPERLEPLPALAGEGAAHLVETVGVIGERLLMVLRAARLVPPGIEEGRSPQDGAP